MNSGFPVSVDGGQWQGLLATIHDLAQIDPYWLRFLILFAPPFLAFILGLASALFLERRKSLRDDQKLVRERQEKELATLNAVSTAMGFNIEALLHTVIDQILPHHAHSQGAVAALAMVTTVEQLKQFFDTMDSAFSAIRTRCPEPYFLEVDFFKEIPFVLAKDPELLKLSGWVVTFERELKNNLRDRNAHIDKASLANETGGLNFADLQEMARIQAVIGNAEVVHSLQLFEQLTAICGKLAKVVEDYKHVHGAHLKVGPPEVLDKAIAELRQIAHSIAPNWPPAEPSAS